MLPSDTYKFKSVSKCLPLPILLFENDLSASSAYAEYKNFLLIKHGDDFVRVSADRAIMPDYKWVFNFHAIYIQEVFGRINSPEAYEKAVKKTEEYNEKNKEVLCSMKQTDDGETIVVVCDNLSKRVHKVLPQSGDIVYVDATSNLDRQDSKLVKFMTCSPAGGLPLGFIITSSENEKTLTEAFEMFKDVLPEDAFHKRGKENGPVLFMTDDADAEINALHTVWPEAKHLLCVWHVLNAVWRWLWKSDHNIMKDDRPYLLQKFRALLYAKSSSEYDKKKTELLSDKTFLKYPNFINHLIKVYFNRQDVWAIFVRNEKKLPTHSTNTSNFVEASFRLTKDGQFNRTKAYNLPDLIDILFDDSVYYKKRLLDIGNGRFGAFSNTKSRYLLKKTNIQEKQIFDIGESHFIVESESTPDVHYQVDMNSGFCECKAGVNCGPCKHKKAITKYKGLAEFTVLPECDAKARALYHYIAEATVCKSSWYRDLKDTSENIQNVTDFVDKRTENIKRNDPIIIGEEVNIDNSNLDYSSTEESIEEESSEEETVDKFIGAMDAFKTKIISSYVPGMKNGLKRFTKYLQKVTKGNVNTLTQSLYKIGSDITTKRSAGKKRKNGKLIPIQVTAKSRRQYKHRGRHVGISGRKPVDQETRMQMVIRDESENVYHSLPKQKKVKKKPLHSLKESVNINKPSAKKH